LLLLLNRRRSTGKSSVWPNISPTLTITALDLIGVEGGLGIVIKEGDISTLEEAEKEGYFSTSEEAKKEGYLGKATTISKAKIKR